jgi:hypothetical protein
MFALLTGRAPFRAKSLTEMLDKQRSAQPEAASRCGADIPRELDEIILQLLAKDPEARIPNAMILARRLEAMVHALNRPAATARDEADSQQRSAPAATPGSMEGATGSLPARVPTALADKPPVAADPATPLNPLLPTRVSHDSPDPAATIDHPAVQADELPQTKLTAAFEAFSPAKRPEPPALVDRFTSVPEEELGKIHRDEPPERPLGLAAHLGAGRGAGGRRPDRLVPAASRLGRGPLRADRRHDGQSYDQVLTARPRPTSASS